MDKRYLPRLVNLGWQWCRQYPRRSLGGLLLLVVLRQLVWFANRLPLFMQIDQRAVGGQSVEAATALLDQAHQSAPIDLRIKAAERPFATVTAEQLGIRSENAQRICQ